MCFKKPGKYSWIVVFLGNPGPRYAMTRHNAGFITADEYAKSRGVRIDRLKFHALTGEAEVNGEKLFLMKPQTYMNESGKAVREAMSFYKVPLDHILVISDDVTLDVGRIRIRRSGSAGGHNGLKDIIANCGGEGFPRIKLGVGKPEYEMIDWVLSAFRDKDAEEIFAAAKKACDAVEEIVKSGVDKAMNDYNG